MDLHFLSELTETPGPYATVYLDASHDSAAARRELELRWAGHRTDLAEQGADEPTLAALDRAVADADPAVGRRGRVLVAADGRVLLDRFLPEPPGRPGATWGPAPDLLPLLLDAPEPVTAVVVRVDRSGGEIMLLGPGVRPEKIDDVTAALPAGDPPGALSYGPERPGPCAGPGRRRCGCQPPFVLLRTLPAASWARPWTS